MMIKRNLKHHIIDLYDFEYNSRSYSVYLIEDEIHIAYNINDKKAFCSVFHCNLLDRRGVADTLELFSYMGNSQMTQKRLKIDDIKYEIQAVTKTDKVLSFSNQYEFMLDPNDELVIYVEELSGDRYQIDMTLYELLNAVIIVSIIIWINVTSNLIPEGSSSVVTDKGNIITLQPDSCIYRYCIIPISDEYLTLNVVGNSPYNTNLVTDYDSDGTYEMKNVKVCTIVSQTLIKMELIKDLYEKIDSVSEN